MRKSLFAQSTFTGKENDEETGYGYFGARYMDYELMTMWLSVDPMADKYPSISPYAYCAWNPVRLVDPDGEEIDLSAIYDKNGNRKKGCENFCKIFEFFAKHKIGQKYLAKYAKAGQTIAGHTYTEDGEFHKKGVDLKIEYGPSNKTPESRSGYTLSKKDNGRLKTTIHVLPETSDKYSKASLLENLCHEFFIHAHQDAKDYSSNPSNWKSNSVEAQHSLDVYTYHFMRDCAVPIMKDYLNGDKQKAIELINYDSYYNKHQTWSRK